LLDIFVNNPGPSPTSSINYTSASHIAISTLAGNDTLILDYSHGEVIPTAGMNYDAGTESDLLHIIGASAADAFTSTAFQINHAGLAIAYASLEALVLGPGQFNFNDDLAGLKLSLDPSATAFFNTTQHIPSLSIASSSVARLTAGGAKVLVVNGLNIAESAGVWTGTLDLGDNDLIIHADALTNADVLNRTTDQIRSARNSGNTPSTRWQGTGIGSSSASLVASGAVGLAVVLNETPDGFGGTTTLHAQFDGEPVDTNTILVKYTYVGDADVDGDIDADDYAQIDTGFATHASGYRNGDFNYSTVINSDDYFAIDLAFASQAGVLGANAAQPALSITTPSRAAHQHTKGAHRQRGRRHLSFFGRIMDR